MSLNEQSTDNKENIQPLNSNLKANIIDANTKDHKTNRLAELFKEETKTDKLRNLLDEKEAENLNNSSSFDTPKHTDNINLDKSNSSFHKLKDLNTSFENKNLNKHHNKKKEHIIGMRTDNEIEAEHVKDIETAEIKTEVIPGFSPHDLHNDENLKISSEILDKTQFALHEAPILEKIKSKFKSIEENIVLDPEAHSTIINVDGIEMSRDEFNKKVEFFNKLKAHNIDSERQTHNSNIIDHSIVLNNLKNSLSPTNIVNNVNYNSELINNNQNMNASNNQTKSNFNSFAFASTFKKPEPKKLVKIFEVKLIDGRTLTFKDEELRPTDSYNYFEHSKL